MLTIKEISGNTVRYRLSGKLSRRDLSKYYATIGTQYRAHGRLQLEVEVVDFRGYEGAGAVIRFLLGEPYLLGRVRSYRAITDDQKFARLIKLLDAIVPWVEFSVTPKTKTGQAP